MNYQGQWFVALLVSLACCFGQMCGGPPAPVEPEPTPEPVPPTPIPPSPAGKPQIFDSLAVPFQSLVRPLTAEEIGYAWLIDYFGVLAPPTTDDYGPDFATLLTDFSLWPLSPYHNIFCQFDVEAGEQVTAATLNLFCLDNSSADGSASPLGIRRILEAWDMTTCREPWQLYNEPDNSFYEEWSAKLVIKIRMVIT